MPPEISSDRIVPIEYETGSFSTYRNDCYSRALFPLGEIQLPKWAQLKNTDEAYRLAIIHVFHPQEDIPACVYTFTAGYIHRANHPYFIQWATHRSFVPQQTQAHHLTDAEWNTVRGCLEAENFGMEHIGLLTTW